MLWTIPGEKTTFLTMVSWQRSTVVPEYIVVKKSLLTVTSLGFITALKFRKSKSASSDAADILLPEGEQIPGEEAGEEDEVQHKAKESEKWRELGLHTVR